MFAEALLASAIQVGPFWQQWSGHMALCPLWSRESEPESAESAEVATTDVLWPVFTSHRDWWRFCLFMHYQEQQDGGYMFQAMPIWFNGNDPESGDYWGLFPLWGNHPHILSMYDVDFCLWPLWMRYKMPRPSERRWMTSNVVLFPFFHWRDDGSWGFWPVCGTGHQRESDHHYALWPIVTWAKYRKDRDTAGEGYSWMFWPLYGQIRRERESQDLFIPPLFSWTKTYSEYWASRGWSAPEMRLRCPWPFFEWESNARRNRLSIWPLYERVDWCSYGKGDGPGSVTRFGWKLVELYDDETRVFPFWSSRKDGSHFRLWPLWESETRDGVSYGRFLALFPIRWVPAVDRNWSPWWTFYESRSDAAGTDHSLLWGIVKWRTFKD